MILRPTFLSLIIATPFLLLADDKRPAKGELIFEDDFERSESQEKKDEPGNGWGTNSRTRANGNKQVDLRDGAMYIYIHETADHGVSVTHPAEFQDGAVGMKFMLEDAKDSLGLNFADLKFKEVHAGHLFVAKNQHLESGTDRLENRQYGIGNSRGTKGRDSVERAPERVVEEKHIVPQQTENRHLV